MSTPKRVWFEGAMYHVTARGNRKDDIFIDQLDFEAYMRMLKEAFEYFEEHNYKLMAYCLMSNHIHLMIKTDTKPLGDLISRVHSIYTKYFNKKHDYEGHLFQGKYYADVIKDEEQLYSVSRYIHLNPVRAKIVNSPEKYRWSSYANYIGQQDDEFICSDIILDSFGDSKYDEYKAFVN